MSSSYEMMYNKAIQLQKLIQSDDLTTGIPNEKKLIEIIKSSEKEWELLIKRDYSQEKQNEIALLKLIMDIRFDKHWDEESQNWK